MKRGEKMKIKPVTAQMTVAEAAARQCTADRRPRTAAEMAQRKGRQQMIKRPGHRVINRRKPDAP